MHIAPFPQALASAPLFLTPDPDRSVTNRDYTFTKYSHYFEAYAVEFSKVPLVRCIIEIGVAGGGSLHFWKQQYPEAEVFGIDVDSMVFFHKRLQEVPRLVTTGGVDCRGAKPAITSSSLPMLKFRMHR